MLDNTTRLKEIAAFAAKHFSGPIVIEIAPYDATNSVGIFKLPHNTITPYVVWYFNHAVPGFYSGFYAHDLTAAAENFNSKRGRYMAIAGKG